MVAVVGDLQTDVYTILNADSNVTSVTTEITDGMPANLIKGGDGPFILVHTPTNTGDRLSISNTKFKNKLRIEIEIFARQEKNVRNLIDKVSTALIDGQDTTRAHKYYWCNPKQNTIEPVWLTGETSKPLWHSSLFVEYFLVA